MPELSVGQAINNALSLILNEYPNSFIAGEDIGIYGGAFGVTDGLLKTFGEERIKDTPISEDVIAGLAVGAAMTDSKPIVEMQFSDFIVNAMDPIVNQAAKLHFMYGGAVNVPIVVRGASGAGTGAAAQHSQSLESWFCHVPGLKVVTPSNPQNAYDLLLHSFVDPNPVIFMEHKLIYKIKNNVVLNDIPSSSELLGKANIESEGNDITIVTYSNMVNVAKDAISSDELSESSIELIDLQTLSPLDMDTIITSVSKTKKLLVCQEAPANSSVGSTVISNVVQSNAFSSLSSAPKLVSGLHSPMPSAKHLETTVIPQKEDIMQAIKDMV
jgi:pyruvate dehydrogenase E1 component beta subunit|tara:strand:- start:1359 stop:2342 length:984 start_codon:yes stop_codon:yes gene_type:complete